jgi:hypothetical protein
MIDYLPENSNLYKHFDKKKQPSCGGRLAHRAATWNFHRQRLAALADFPPDSDRVKSFRE